MSWLRTLSRASTLSLLALPLFALAGAGGVPGCAKTGSDTGDGSAAAGDDGGSSNSSYDGGIVSGDAGMIAVPCVPGWQIIGACQDAGAPTVGPSPLRRISRIEYNNMVRDLLGDTTQPASQFVSESPLTNGVNFNSNTYTYVTSTLIPQQYLQAAETLADTAANQNLTKLLASPLVSSAVAGACGTHNSACAQSFIDYFANKAFRGQYDSTQSAALMKIYTDTSAQFDFPTGIQAVITTVLTSPRFLFVFEFGTGSPTGNAVLLSQNELAARLAFFLWRSVPDDQLMNDAKNNLLSTPDQIQTEAVRMLADSKALDSVHDFVSQWMEIENIDAVTKDAQFTAWSAAVADALKWETWNTFAGEVLSENGGKGATLSDLMTSGQSYITAPLATYYGVSSTGLSDGGAGTKVSVNPAGVSVRAGILTQGSVMASQSHPTLTSPTRRGKLVREQVLCDPVSQPPAAVNGMPIPPPPASLQPGETTREASEMQRLAAGTVCLGCHTYMDPIGYAFGNIDATGAYQATDSNGFDAGAAVDAASSVNSMVTGEPTIHFSGPVDLATQLAADPQVAECYAVQEFRYALGRIEDYAGDSCSVTQIYQSFTSNNLNLQSVLIAIVRSDAFRYRPVVTGGSACPVGNCR